MKARQIVQWVGALFIILSFILDTVLTLASLRLEKTKSGMFQFTVSETDANTILPLVLFVVVLAGAFLFIVGAIIAYKRGGRHAERQRLTVTNMVLCLGWVGLVNLAITFASYGIEQWVPETVASSLDSTIFSISLQIAAILVIPMYYKGSWKNIGLSKGNTTWRTWGLVILLSVAIYLISFVTDQLSVWFHLNPGSYRETQISHDLHQAVELGPWTAFGSWLSTGFFAPLGEELIFRGVIQSTLTARLGGVWGMTLSTFAFAFIHADISLFVPILLMGFVLSYAYHHTKSLWVSSVLHMANNTVATLYDVLFP